MELYVSHGMPENQAATEIKQKIVKYLDDPNVSSLLLGAILLEDELSADERFRNFGWSGFLLSDEIIGMAIAECIGEPMPGLSYPVWPEKARILSKLGPFLDDA